MKCFPSSSDLTHMPFVVEHKDKTLLLFSVSESLLHVTVGGVPAEYHPWALGWSDWYDENDGIHLIETGLPPESVSCNIVGSVRNEELLLSFVERDNLTQGYRMLEMHGPDIEHLSVPAQVVPPSIWSGFFTSHYTCVVPADRDRIIIRDLTMFVKELDNIVRAIPSGESILVTGMKNHTEKTYMMNRDGIITGEVRCNGASLYKSSIWGPDVVFAQKDLSRGANSFEDRELHWGELTIEALTL